MLERFKFLPCLAVVCMVFCFISLLIDGVIISLIGLILFVAGILCILASIKEDECDISIQEFFIKEPSTTKK